jgi:4-amino-4-deoxy-L-arabinose transferase-like glycosyltransferase
MSAHEEAVRPPLAAEPGRSAAGFEPSLRGIALCALLLRLAVAGFALRRFGPAWFFHRGMEMGSLAQSVLAGHGLSSVFGPPSGPTALVAPAYPLLVALVFRLFGVASPAAAIVLLGAQALAGSATVYFLGRAGRSLFSERAALAAALVWALSLPLLWIPTIFWETSFSIFLLTLFLWLLARNQEPATQEPATPRLALRPLWLGACCGLLALFNPAMLPSLVGMAAVRFRSFFRGSLLSAGAFLLTAALVYSPWPIRNARVLHAFIPARSTVGFELWMGNREGSRGYLDESLFPTFNAAELHRYLQIGEVAYMKDKSDQARRWIGRHPAAFARLTLERGLRFWSGSGTQAGSGIFILYGSLTSAGCVAGLLLLLGEGRRETFWLLLVPLLLFPLPYYITHAEFRYRLGIDPLATLLTGYALARGYAWCQARSRACPAESSGMRSLSA